MKRIIHTALAGIAFLSVVSTAKAQQKPAVQEKPTLHSAITDNWKFISTSFINVAEAMPEEKYNFAPMSGSFTGVRTFAEQVKHVACANFAFFREMEKLEPPPDCENGGGPDPSRTKTEIMKYLRDSFAYSNTVIAKIDAQNMLDTVQGRYAGPNTRIGMVMIAVWHCTDHYGQMVEYLRMNGVVPPGSK